MAESFFLPDQFQGSEDMPAMQMPEDPQMRAAAQVKALRAPYFPDTEDPAAPGAQPLPIDPEIQAAVQVGTGINDKAQSANDAMYQAQIAKLAHIFG